MTALCLAILSQNWAGPQQTHFFIHCETWQPQADPISHVVILALSTKGKGDRTLPGGGSWSWDTCPF